MLQVWAVDQPGVMLENAFDPLRAQTECQRMEVADIGDQLPGLERGG